MIKSSGFQEVDKCPVHRDSRHLYKSTELQLLATTQEHQLSGYLEPTNLSIESQSDNGKRDGGRTEDYNSDGELSNGCSHYR